MRRAGVPWTGQELAALRDATGKEIEDFYTAETPQVLVPAPVQRHCLITAISSNYFQLLGGAAACAAGGMAGGLPICLALSKLASALRHSREITRVCSRRVTHRPNGAGDDNALPICGLRAKVRCRGWATLSEHKWSSFGERRGSGVTPG